MSPSRASSLEFPGTPSGSLVGLNAALRKSVESALSHGNLFTTHAPFDAPLMDGPLGHEGGGGDEGEEASMLSPLAREPACKGDGSQATWADAVAEIRRLLSLAVPLVLQSMASMLLTLVSTVFVGRLNDAVALGGVVLASSVYNVTGISMVIGLSSALDTLCGQAYGARQYKLLGVYRQRAQLICWTLCLPIAAVWLNAHSLLLAIGQEPAIVDVAARYMHILTPSLFISVVSDTCRRYLLAQRVVVPGMVASIATTLLSPVYNYIFIHQLGWRTDGAAVAVLLCNATNASLLTCYSAWRDWRMAAADDPRSTWPGCQLRAALSGWGQYLSLGLPAAAMICLEWWVWEIMVISAGVLPRAPDVAVAVMGLLLTINSMFYMVPASLGSATSTRVANSLGAGNAEGARLVFRVSALLTLCIGGAAACLTYLLRRPLVSLFTEEPAVVALAARALPFMALSLLGDSCVAVLGNVLRAAGRQGYGATLNILGYWCLGLPLSMFLGFRLDLGIIGFWIGLSTAAAFQAVVFATVISRFDWRHEVQRSEDLLAANLAAGGGGNAEATPLLPDDGGSGSGSSGDDGGAAKASGGGLVISPDDEETGAGAAAAAGVQSTLDGDLRSPFLPQ